MSFPRYPEYKDGGVEWLGEVPAHWDVTRLKRNLNLVTDKAGRRENPIALENIESQTGRFIPTETEFEGEGVAFRAGDVLFGKLRPYLAKVFVAKAAGEAVGDFHVMRPTPAIFPRYAQYQMLSREFIDIVDGSTFGSKMPRASWEFVGAMEMPMPPLVEQEAIFGFLDRETAKIDLLMAEQEKLIALLKEKRQAVISHAVTKGLDPSVPMKDSGIEWLGEVPAHWEVSRIKWVARMESGHTPDKKVAAYWEDCNIPWVSLNDTGYLKENDYISDTAVRVNELGIANSSARIIPSGSVVFSRDATIGRCAITARPMAVSQHFIAWVCDEGRIIPEFLLRVFRSMTQVLDRLTFGATVKTIGMPDIRTLITAVPPVGEQQKIVSYLRDAITKHDALIDAVEAAASLLKERRSALISAAVTGKIDVRNFRKEAA